MVYLYGGILWISLSPLRLRIRERNADQPFSCGAPFTILANVPRIGIQEPLGPAEIGY
jgi:hypothetical protein